MQSLLPHAWQVVQILPVWASAGTTGKEMVRGTDQLKIVSSFTPWKSDRVNHYSPVNFSDFCILIQRFRYNARPLETDATCK